MAQEDSNATSSVSITPLVSGMMKDVDDTYIPEGAWSHARNATKVTANGSLNTLSNEPSNKNCINTTHTIIGYIHLFEDKWVIFSTNDTISEIGLFDDSDCAYLTLVTDPCTMDLCTGTLIGNTTSLLNFKKRFLIKGAAKQNFDCTWTAYFADGNNPDRIVTIDTDALIPKIIESQFVRCRTFNANMCIDDVATCKIDCEQIRLSPLMSSPCIKVSRSRSGGTLLNGSYYATIAYTLNSQQVTSFFPPSNTQPVFVHNNLGGSITVTFEGLDTTHFSEFELVIVKITNLQAEAKKMGIYSTQTKEMVIDYINVALPNIPIEQLPVVNPIMESSEAIYAVGDYLTRIAPTSRFDFNYQPLANTIRVKWQVVEYPGDYYRNGGNAAGLMRDEIYPFFIRWIYNTGDRSASYHIPGRYKRAVSGTNPPIDETGIWNADSIYPGEERYFEVVNTAVQDPGLLNIPTDDGGVILAQGDMAYWESLEHYPDDKPDVWDLSNWATVPGWSTIPGMGFPEFNLCGTPIRHHKMPENLTSPECAHVRTDSTGKPFIRLIGIKVENVLPPLDNLGNPIPGIVGYEILRGSREGNKTIIAKGIVNNIRTYKDVTGATALYQNYPYNYTGTDPSLLEIDTSGGLLYNPAIGNRVQTFHSPDTNFRYPFLAMDEMKHYGILTADVEGQFQFVPGHPKEKLLTDWAFALSALMGIGEAVLAVRGRRTIKNAVINSGTPTPDGVLGQTFAFAGVAGVTIPPTPAFVAGAPTLLIASAGGAAYAAAVNALVAAGYGYNIANTLGLIFSGQDIVDSTFRTANSTAFSVPGIGVAAATVDIEPSAAYANPFSAAIGIPTMLFYWTQGADTLYRFFQAMLPFEQYAMRYISHGYYNKLVNGSPTRRFKINSREYLSDQRQNFESNSIIYPVNNLYRARAVILDATTASGTGIGVTTPYVGTYSDSGGQFSTLQTVGTANTNGLGPDFDEPEKGFKTRTSSYYTALIQRLKSQYGQLDSIHQIVISCKYPIGVTSTDLLLNGDTYVTRYTEKNTFFYFHDWLYKQFDGYEYNYQNSYMITDPKFWANFQKYDPSEFLGSLTGGPGGILGTPSDRHNLDGDALDSWQDMLTNFTRLFLEVVNHYFYLFQSGVRDFFVESEVNTEFRDWKDNPEDRFYDPKQYTSLFDLFDTPIIKAPNLYIYDYSLSASRMWAVFSSWGAMQSRDYNPFVAASCYVHLDNRLIYSLPQNLENKKDYWRVFLANNYKDFYSKVSVIKSFNQNGAIILFTNDSPVLWKGVDTLESDIGTKITIGDGGLFAQPPQSVVNTDQSYEYGSCQDRLSVINTPFGVYFISSAQGKIFHLTSNLDDITYSGLKFWFKEYLPFKLLQDFPTFDILDNPVVGIGCQTIYDNQIETIYFCKKDYRLRDDYRTIVNGVKHEPLAIVTYDQGTGTFTARGTDPGTRSVTTGILPGDPIYFQDASWTVSYDPKSEKGGWISFHDWHPTLNIPSRMNFLTVQNNSVWRHNQRRDDFCKFYNVYYPFEVEYIASTKLSVNSLRSIEYYMECYKYPSDTLDRFHMLNWNFDQAVVYNTEQVSGLLKLNLAAVNDPWGNLAFPNLTPQPAYNILYNKEEQKYRFNQFWDITDNRGEFTQDTRQIWVTDPNGYTRTLNPGNLNYAKAQTQRKKFRHYLNKTILTKLPPGPGATNPINMTVKVIADKNLLSMR